jgi:hypothetical protein
MDKRSDPDGEPSEGVAAGGQADPTAPDQLDTDTWRAWERQFGTPQPEPVAGPSVSIGHPGSHESSEREPDPDRPGYDRDGRWIKSRDFWERIDRIVEEESDRRSQARRPWNQLVRYPTRRARRRLGAWLWSRVRRWWP